MHLALPFQHWLWRHAGQGEYAMALLGALRILVTLLSVACAVVTHVYSKHPLFISCRGLITQSVVCSLHSRHANIQPQPVLITENRMEKNRVNDVKTGLCSGLQGQLAKDGPRFLAKSCCSVPEMHPKIILLSIHAPISLPPCKSPYTRSFHVIFCLLCHFILHYWGYNHRIVQRGWQACNPHTTLVSLVKGVCLYIRKP